jgi:hypothetical protein
VLVSAENSDVIATYASRDEALQALAKFVEANPRVQDELGLRIYEHGRPVGAWESASQLLGEHVAQRHLV